MNKTLSLINDFYEDVSVEYSNYHNQVTSPSIIKAVFKKVNNQEIINKYNELLHRLTEIKKESVSLPESVLKDHFLMELDYFKSILDSEINLYISKDTAPIDVVKYLSNRRLQVQKEFLEFDSVFRVLIQEEMKNNK